MRATSGRFARVVPLGTFVRACGDREVDGAPIVPSGTPFSGPAASAPSRARQERALYAHLHPIRAALTGDDGTTAHLLLPYDEAHVSDDEAAHFASDLETATRERLAIEIERARSRARPEQDVRDFTLAAIRPARLDQLTLRVMLQAPPMNLEHLTYGSSGIEGTEPHPELEG